MAQVVLMVMDRDVVLTMTYVKADGSFCRGRYHLTIVRVGEVVFPQETASGFVAVEGTPIEATVACRPIGADRLLTLDWQLARMKDNGSYDGWRSPDHWAFGNGLTNGVYRLKVLASADGGGADERIYRQTNSTALVYRSFAVIGWPKLVFDYDRDGIIADSGAMGEIQEPRIISP